MPEHQLPTQTTRSSSSQTAASSTTRSTAATSNSAAAEQVAAQNKPRVIAYLTQNSTTHHKDEIPETLAALAKADSDGLGQKKIIPISDPFSDGHQTYNYSFGKKNASKLQWWHDDTTLKEGQVKAGDQTLTLGAEDKDRLGQGDIQKIAGDWQTALGAVGIDAETSAKVVGALFKDSSGKWKMNESNVGGSNELMQMISVLNRAEQGEFELSGIVLSGHHYSNTPYIFGEKGEHEYDMNDTFNFNDLEALRGVFPKAFSQVDSFQFSACNTHGIDQQDASGNELSTNQWVQGLFPNVQSVGYWEGIAPGADMASFFSGEFALDQARKEGGDKKAMGDALFRQTSKGTFHRAERGSGGKVEDVNLKKNTSSYSYNNYKGLRNSNGEAFHKRRDLMKYVHQKD